MGSSGMDEIRFFGKIAAGITHEMKNVLAIIKESTGLMEDLLALCKEVEIPHREKFGNALQAVKTQIARGVELSARLNRFAHSTDEETARVDLADLVEQVRVLSQRFARLQNVELQTTFPQEGSECLVTISPVRMQMILFGCINIFLSLMPAGGELVISLARGGEGFQVTLTGRGDLPQSDECARLIAAREEWGDLLVLCRDLRADLEFVPLKRSLVLSLS